MEIDVRDLLYSVSVIGVWLLEGYRIKVEFDGGKRGTYDMRPILTALGSKSGIAF